MSARLLADLETADAVVRAIDSVDGFEVRGVRAADDRRISINLRHGKDHVASLACVLGEIYETRVIGPDYTLWTFVWRGVHVSVIGDTVATAVASAA